MNLLEQLKAAGLTDDQSRATENILRQFIAGEYIPKSRFDEVNEKNKSLAQELGRAESERDTAEKRAKKAEEEVNPLKEKITSVDAEWKKKYEDLQADYKQKEADRVAKETYDIKYNAVLKCLQDSAHDNDMVVSLLDFDTLEITDGKVSGVEKAVDALRKQKPFLFKSDDWSSTAPTSAPKGEGGSGQSFGEQLAKKALSIDQQTEAAAKKYFG